MKVTLNRINEDYLLEGKGHNNISVLIDNKTNKEINMIEKNNTMNFKMTFDERWVPFNFN